MNDYACQFCSTKDGASDSAFLCLRGIGKLAAAPLTIEAPESSNHQHTTAIICECAYNVVKQQGQFSVASLL